MLTLKKYTEMLENQNRCLFCGKEKDKEELSIFCCKEHEDLFHKKHQENIKKGLCYRCGSEILTEEEKLKKVRICENCRRDIIQMMKNIEDLGKDLKW